ncbi:MAG TPA: hypothetical protein VNH40_07955 [Gaiellaceae bacterium]|nr:hypothetical protein [Gaiellaceae bacterium]
MEARALLTRLGRVKPFALQETMLPAAALSPAAQVAIERLLVLGRLGLRKRVLAYLHWLRGPGRATPPAEMQRRYTRLRLAFNNALSQFDTFSSVITQRSENETGVWLSGLDSLAADALKLPGVAMERPEVICYLDRGPGAAIRRARTRMPGGGLNPVAIVRVPRERMVGHGIGSSLIHEVGHQGAVLLGLLDSLKPELERRRIASRPADREPWALWSRWRSEVLADLWSVAMLGIGATVGLMGVVSLPPWYVFRLSPDDPHPIPWIRVRLSCAMGRALYPHPQWDELARIWESLYPVSLVQAEAKAVLHGLLRTLPAFVETLLGHRPRALGGRPLRAAFPTVERTPHELARLHRRWRTRPGEMRDAAPTLAFAVLGQARYRGAINAREESRIIGNLLTFWALKSTLVLAEICAVRADAAGHNRS